MKTIQLREYGHVISDSSIGQRILEDIDSGLKVNELITIDFSEIISMATFCSKQIFGSLYLKLTPKEFFKRIKIENASNDMRIIVRLGVEKALEDSVQ